MVIHTRSPKTTKILTNSGELLIIGILTLSILLLGANIAAATQNQVQQQNPDKASIEQGLIQEKGTIEILVELKGINQANLTDQDRETTIDKLQNHSKKTRKSLENYAKNTQGIEIKNKFWISNTVLLETNLDNVSLQEIAGIDGVRQINRNHRIETQQSITTQSTDFNATWGVDRVNATEVWRYYDDMGGGVKVAVLDSGVNESHPDIDLFTNNSSDPTYPGGWAEFNSSGGMVEGSTPHDTTTHGTHVSGTVSGGNASGEYIGVAPNVSLMHGLVVPNDSGSVSQINAGIQWAVNNSADVISMSLGGPCDQYISGFIDPILNAQQSGVITVAAVGNCNGNQTKSPGNVFDAYAVGNINSNNNVRSNSGGDLINTGNAWGSSAPNHWPNEYIKPDVVAPGSGIKSSQASGGYTTLSGTSQATPHVSGGMALIQSTTDSVLTPSELKKYMNQSAWKPSGEPSSKDVEYGEGIIDLLKAVSLANINSTIKGNVTTTSGNPIPNITVETELGLETTTNQTGYYVLDVPDMTQNITVSDTPRNNDSLYETNTTTFTPPSGGVKTVNYELELNVCKYINKPGSYKIRSDHFTDEADNCIYVSTSDVHINGTNKLIDGLNNKGNGVKINGTGQIENVSIQDLSLYNWSDGIDIRNAANVSLVNLDQVNNEYGVNLTDTDSFDFESTSITITNKSVIKTDNSSYSTRYLDIENANISINATDVDLDDGTGIPKEPENKLNISHYLALDNSSQSSIVNSLDMHYSDSDIPSEMDESSLKIWRHNGSNWSIPGDSHTVNITENKVSVNNISNFSKFAPLGNPPPMNFTTNITGTNSPVVDGENITVNASITNIGQLNGTQQIKLEIDGNQTDSLDLTLSINETKNVSLKWSTNLGDAGNYTAKISSENTSSITNITVHIPPIGNLSQRPKDINGDGKYRDTNGDGVLDATDIQVFFQNRKDEVVQTYFGSFDFNNESVINIGDPQALFRQIIG